MPKKKGNPQKLSALKRRDENYRFGGCGGASKSQDDSGTSTGIVKKSPQVSPQKRRKENSVEVEVVEGLEDLLSDCTHYVPIIRSLKSDDCFCLGHVTFKVHDHCISIEETLPAEEHDFWLYVSCIPGRSMIYFEWLEREGTFKRVKFFTLEETLDSDLYDVSPKFFSLALDNFNNDTRELTISFNIRKAAIINKHDAICYDKGKIVSVQRVMKHLYDIDIPVGKRVSSSNHSRDDIEALYAAVKSYHETNTEDPIKIDVQHHSLQVQLRPYQRSAVLWMFQREALLHTPQNTTQLHPLYKEISTKDGQVLYYNFHLGTFVYEKPICNPPTPGGILADEMGLGKTVEVLSCMLANPRTDLPSVQKKEPNESLNSSNVEPSEIFDVSCNDSSAELQDSVKVEDLKDSENESTPEVMEVLEENCKMMEVDTAAGPSSAGDMFENKQEAGCSFEKVIETEEDDDGTQKRRSSRKCVRFSEAPVISYDDFQLDSDSSDVSWSENLRFGDHVRPKKQKTVKKPLKRLKKNTKSILKNPEPNETIVAVKTKNRGKATDKIIAQQISLAKRQAARDLYENALAAYSATKFLHQKRYSGFFDQNVQRKSLFECVCGDDGDSDSRVIVKCSTCEVWQHAECVHFDNKSHQEYFCPHCWQLQPKVQSRATLIVAPAAISQQWMDEIHKLIVHKGIVVNFYKGINGEGFVQPHSLADVDIVITSYETLCKELDYVDLPHGNAEEGRRFRNAKRYMALPSPLPCVQWWRVCLDEAQMVEAITTKTAEMALRLAAVHRWCITGTPVQKSITDLFGLFMFLGVDPYCHYDWWSIILQDPYRAGNPEALYSILCPLMWRTSKINVLDQIGIPAQSEQIHWIHFSPVEEHFYRRQHSQCANVVLNRISQLPNLDEKLHMLPKDVLSGLISPLLGLRQACCHPQAVKGMFMSLNKTTLTMEELLDTLIKKARVECEESFRQVVAALNGLAGIHVIEEDWLNAVERYRDVLRLVEENRGKMKADKLQRIHTLHNLAELLESQAENTNIPRTLRDCKLKQEAQELETDYLNKCIVTMKGAQQAAEPLTEAVATLQDQLLLSDAWWSLTLNWAAGQRENQEVVERVRQALIGGKKKQKGIMYNSLKGLENLLLDNTDSLDHLREKLLSEMKKLETEDSQSLVNEAVECHLRTMPNPEGTTKKKLCKLCKTSELFEDYEKLLFREEETNAGHEVVENVRVFGKLNRITWAAGETEKVLKAILGYAKLKKVDESWISDGNTQVKILDAEKKEFKHLRIYWRQLNDHVSAADELNMCKLRLRLRFPHEPSLIKKKQSKKAAGKQPLDNLSSNLENKVENIYILEPHEVTSYALRLTTERSTAQGDLRRRMGQLHYLENLQKSGIGHKGGSNPELCPICRKALGEKWCVLVCGHCYCVECLAEFRRHHNNKRLVCCPVCREITSLGEISYVNTKMQQDIDNSSSSSALANTPIPQTSDADQETPQVLARNSAKAEAVVQALKNIQMENKDAKALVFSTWTNMLLVLARALRENDISYAHIESGKKFQIALDLFKDSTKNVTALLLPVHSGANGLNLIEATHVLLVEPILNTASELQALGRVHRIGQTKATVVHRFIVRGTIEERMHEVLRAHQKSTMLDEDPVTLRDLYNMFASSSDNPTNNESNEGRSQITEIEGQDSPSSSTA